MTNDLPKTYTPAQAAEILGVTRRTIYSYLKGKQLKGVQTPTGQWRITNDELQRFMGLAK